MQFKEVWRWDSPTVVCCWCWEIFFSCVSSLKDRVIISEYKLNILEKRTSSLLLSFVL